MKDMSLSSLLSFERMDITSHLRNLCKFVAAGEVPVRALDALGQTHDVIAVAVLAGAHHIVEHELEVLGRRGVADEEEASAGADAAERHRLAHDLERLLLLEGVT